MALGTALEAPAPAPAEATRRARAQPPGAPAVAADAEPVDAGPSPEGEAAPAEGGAGKASAAERRRALATLLDLWREVARDLECASRGATGSVRDVALLEDLERAAAGLPHGAAADALAGSSAPASCST